MMSFQTIYTQVQSLCNDDNANVLVTLKNFINQTYHNLLANRPDITETSATHTSVASTAYYYLPNDYGKMNMVTVTVGGIAYPVVPIEDERLWRDLVARSASYTSDIPQFYYIYDDNVYLYPTPASSGNTITLYYHKRVRDLTQADYTTGTVSALAAGATAVTGGSTVWTASMIGRYFRVTSDGYWYEISSRTSDTVIGLTKSFTGTTITGGSEAYTIGEMPIIPEAYHELLVWRPVALYYMQKGEHDVAKNYWMQYDGGYTMGLRKEPGALLDMFLNDSRSKTDDDIISGDMLRIKKDTHLVDPNAYPLSLTS